MFVFHQMRTSTCWRPDSPQHAHALPHAVAGIACVATCHPHAHAPRLPAHATLIGGPHAPTHAHPSTPRTPVHTTLTCLTQRIASEELGVSAEEMEWRMHELLLLLPGLQVRPSMSRSEAYPVRGLPWGVTLWSACILLEA